MAYAMYPSRNQDPGFELPVIAPNPQDELQARLADAYAAHKDKGVVPAIVNMARALRESTAAQPQQNPITVSGGDVIGLTPEQTSGLLDRVQRQNMLNQQMGEQRRRDAEAEVRARRGEVMRASEAEKRYQRELSIEETRLKHKADQERLKSMQPTLTPLAGNPGYATKEWRDEQGNPQMQIVEVPGVRPAVEPKMGWVEQGDGTKKYTELSSGMIQRKESFVPSPDEQSRVIEMLNKSNLTQEERNNVYGVFVKSGQLPNIEFREKDADGIDTGFSTITVTNEDGSKEIKRVPNSDLVNGISIYPPKDKNKPDPFQYLQKTFGMKWADRDLQTLANALGQAGYTPDQIRGALGPDINEGYFYNSKNYDIPSEALSPAGISSKPTFKGRDGKDYIDNGDGTATLVE